MPAATMTSKGQITLPIEIREKLKLTPGTKVEFVEVTPGHFELFAKTRSISDLRGIVPKPARPVTPDEMDAAIAEGAISRVSG